MKAFFWFPRFSAIRSMRASWGKLWLFTWSCEKIVGCCQNHREFLNFPRSLLLICFIFKTLGEILRAFPWFFIGLLEFHRWFILIFLGPWEWIVQRLRWIICLQCFILVIQAGFCFVLLFFFPLKFFLAPCTFVWLIRLGGGLFC